MQLDASIVNVAIRADFGASGQVAWVMDACTVPIAALLLAAGTLGDQIGCRTVYRCGLVIFLAGTVFRATAPTVAALIGGRIVQAIGARALAATTLAMLVRSVPDPSARQRSVGLWGRSGARGSWRVLWSGAS